MIYTIITQVTQVTHVTHAVSTSGDSGVLIRGGVIRAQPKGEPDPLTHTIWMLLEVSCEVLSDCEYIDPIEDGLVGVLGPSHSFIVLLGLRGPVRKI